MTEAIKDEAQVIEQLVKDIQSPEFHEANEQAEIDILENELKSFSHYIFELHSHSLDDYEHIAFASWLNKNTVQRFYESSISQFEDKINLAYYSVLYARVLVELARLERYSLAYIPYLGSKLPEGATNLGIESVRQDYQRQFDKTCKKVQSLYVHYLRFANHDRAEKQTWSFVEELVKLSDTKLAKRLVDVIEGYRNVSPVQRMHLYLLAQEILIYKSEVSIVPCAAEIATMLSSGVARMEDDASDSFGIIANIPDSIKHMENAQQLANYSLNFTVERPFSTFIAQLRSGIHKRVKEGE